jgi:hypothetical protein
MARFSFLKAVATVMTLSLVLAQDDGNYGNDYGEYAEYQDYNNDYNQEDNMYYDYEQNKKYVDRLVSNKENGRIEQRGTNTF